MEKKKIITAFSKLSNEIKGLISREYPFGFEQFLIPFPGKDGTTKALFLETDKITYLVKFSKRELINLSSQYSAADYDQDEAIDYGIFLDDIGENTEDLAS